MYEREREYYRKAMKYIGKLNSSVESVRFALQSWGEGDVPDWMKEEGKKCGVYSETTYARAIR